MTALLVMVAVERTELLLEKMELEVEVKVGWLEVIVVAFGMVVCGWEDTALERKGWAGEMEATEKSMSSSEGILQMG